MEAPLDESTLRTELATLMEKSSDLLAELEEVRARIQVVLKLLGLTGRIEK